LDLDRSLDILHLLSLGFFAGRFYLCIYMHIALHSHVCNSRGVLDRDCANQSFRLQLNTLNSIALEKQ